MKFVKMNFLQKSFSTPIQGLNLHMCIYTLKLQKTKCTNKHDNCILDKVVNKLEKREYELRETTRRPEVQRGNLKRQRAMTISRVRNTNCN